MAEHRGPDRTRPERAHAVSEALFARAERVIPLGSQTFSKSRTQYPYGVSPYFISHGQGSRVAAVGFLLRSLVPARSAREPGREKGRGCGVHGKLRIELPALGRDTVFS